MTQSTEIPTPPRPVTPAAARRAWLEGRVRFWWLCALVVLIAMTIFGVSQMLTWWRDRELIVNGVAVDAHIDEANGSPLARKFVREQPVAVKLSFTLAYGTKQVVSGILGPPGDPVTAGTTMRIHYDPKNPNRWTDRTDVPPWTRELTVVWMLLPIVAILIVITWWRRGQVLRIWRDEPAMEAVVVGLRHSPTAPLSRVLSYALREGDRRVCQTLYPVRAGVPEEGESIWIVAPMNAPQRGIVAKLYQ